MCKRLGPSFLLWLLLLWPAISQAQLIVHDPGNAGINSVTAGQTTITAIQAVIIAIEAVFQSSQWVLDLMPLEGIAVAGGIAEDMALLGQLVEQAEGLSYDVSSLQSQIESLFGLETAPSDTFALQERLAEIRRVRYQSYTYAMRVQTLLNTAGRTVEHLVGLLDTLGQILGNVSGNQTNGQFQSVIAKHSANIDVQLASYQRAGAVDKMEELLTIESWHRINCLIYERDC